MSVCKNLYLRRVDKYHYDPIRNEITNLVEVPCGKCTNCKIQIAKEWALRCCLELPYWEKAIFTTLTFRDSEMTDLSIHKTEFSEFIHNIRNDLRKEKKQIKVLGCGEYGDESMRKHYHAIIFGIGLGNEKTTISKNCETYLSENSIIEKNWTKGNVFNGVVTYNSCRYVASYVFKKYYDDLKEEVYINNGLENPFQHTSQGIGRQFFNEYKNTILDNGYIMFNGIKHTIPRYFLELYEKEDKINNSFENTKKLKRLQIEHAEDKFNKWYKNYTEKLSKILVCNPDDFNVKTLKNVDSEFIVEYYKQIQQQNEASANLAEARNKLY